MEGKNWRIQWVESERGWGRSYSFSYFDSLTEALAARASNVLNNDADYVKNGFRVPDYYIQCEKIQTKVANKWVDYE